ncbi:MAG: hypothetical protein H7287_09960 [Thermoleophilia bacterium]|nr:hypothetical protein [Thermoleophilia bacterium]
MATDLDAVFASATPTTTEPEPVAPERTGGLLPAGEYEGVVAGAEVRSGFRPWVEQELSLRLTVDAGEFNGRTTFCDIELSPLHGRDGQISSGKVGYLKWQITDVLGYDGVLSELDQHAGTFVGTRVSFEQKITLAAKVNPATGTPYENREVTLKAKLGAAPAGSAIDTSAFAAAVAAPTAEDDDIPF